jgi:hypothetical protein
MLKITLFFRLKVMILTPKKGGLRKSQPLDLHQAAFVKEITRLSFGINQMAEINCINSYSSSA